VLAHEVAHVERRHGLRNVAHRAGVALGMQLLVGAVLGLDLDGWGALASEAAQLARASGYSRAQESEADADAARIMHAAGLDPRALARFFRAMEREAPGEEAALASWLSTHPDHEARARTIESFASAWGPTERRPLDVDLAAARAALGSGERGR
jgi:beta-barrel assembly-enhancing protease